MYNVHVKRYTVAQVRRRLAEALDGAERGEPVVIERRGVRFRLQAVRPPRRSRSGSGRGLIEFMDPALDAGNWSWTLQSGKLRFAARRRRA
jgi:antitoxin (DNA-binding transcriptional repressor) of toxin-antitoxin stability system